MTDREAKAFTMNRWYHFGLLNPTLRRFIMLVITVVVMVYLVFYIVPVKYAIGVIAVCVGYLVVFLGVRNLAKASKPKSE